MFARTNLRVRWLRTWAVVFATLASTISSATAQPLVENGVLNGVRGPVMRLSFSADGKWLASTSAGGRIANQKPEQRLNIFDVESRTEIASWTGEEHGLLSSAIAPDRRLIAIGGWQSGLTFFDVRADNGKIQLEPRQTKRSGDSIHGTILFTGDGNQLVIAGTQISFLDVATNALKRTIKTHSSHSNVTLSPDGKTLAVSNHQDVDFYDVASGEERGSLLDHRGAVASVAYSSNGKAVAVSSVRSQREQMPVTHIKLWDCGKSTEINELNEVKGYPRFLAISRDAKTLLLAVSVDLQGPTVFKLVDVSAGNWKDSISFKGRSDSPTAIAADPAGSVVAMGFSDGSIRLWNVTAAK